MPTVSAISPENALEVSDRYCLILSARPGGRAHGEKKKQENFEDNPEAA
jgi:hypothetical protein